MLSLHKIVHKVSKHLTLNDRIIIKIDLIVVGVLLAKLFPILATLHRLRYVGIIVLIEIYFIKRFKKYIR